MAKNLADYYSYGETSPFPERLEELIDTIFSQGKSLGATEAFIVGALINGGVLDEENAYSNVSDERKALMMARIRGLAELFDTTPEHLLAPYKSEEERLLAKRVLEKDDLRGVLSIPRSVWTNAVRAAKVATKYGDFATVSDALKIMRDAVAELEKAYESF